MNELIIETFHKNGLELTLEQANLFNIYLNLLLKYNQEFNLTAITDKKEIILKHFVDSCLLNDTFKQGCTVCDVGSGAGFPAIPLKILRPDLKITMIDSLNKRVEFLKTVTNQLNLSDITAFHSRAQEFCASSRESFDYTTARAVAPLNILSELCLPITKLGGAFVAFKSQDAENDIKNAENAINILGGKIAEIKQITLKSDTEFFVRKQIIIEKISPTPIQYPRLKDKITKSPL